MEKKGVLLAKKAVEYLEENDPDLVEGGCSDVSEIIGAFLRTKGFKARTVYGIARKGKDKKGIMHAWLEIDGERFDPVLWIGGRDLKSYRYEESPGVKNALTDESIVEEVIRDFVPELEAMVDEEG